MIYQNVRIDILINEPLSNAFFPPLPLMGDKYRKLAGFMFVKYTAEKGKITIRREVNSRFQRLKVWNLKGKGGNRIIQKWGILCNI